MLHSPNRKNDRIWEHGSSKVPAIETAKHPKNGMMSYQLRMFTKPQPATAEYYTKEALKRTGASAMERPKQKQSSTTVKIQLRMSKEISQAVGAPLHDVARA